MDESEHDGSTMAQTRSAKAMTIETICFIAKNPPNLSHTALF